MTDINFHNYEAWALDYLEGRLTAEQAERLRSFVLAHPELGIDLSDTEQPVLSPDTATMPASLLRKDLPSEEETRVLEFVEGQMDAQEKRLFENQAATDDTIRRLKERFELVRFSPEPVAMDKKNLYRDIPAADEERVLVYREGLLNDASRKTFEEALRSDANLAELNRQFEQCKLTADEQIRFEGKESLIRRTKVVSIWHLPLRAAAAILLLAMLVAILWPKHAVISPPEVASARQQPADETPVHVATQPERAVSMPMASQETPVTSAPRSKKTSAQHKQPALIAARQETARDTSVTPPAEQPEEMVSNNTPKDLFAAMTDKNDSTHVTAAAESPQLVITSLENLPVAEESVEPRAKKGFWEKAAQLVQQFDKLGLKTVQASRDDQSVSLTFNELAIEKKFGRL